MISVNLFMILVLDLDSYTLYLRIYFTCSWHSIFFLLFDCTMTNFHILIGFLWNVVCAWYLVISHFHMVYVLFNCRCQVMICKCFGLSMWIDFEGTCIVETVIFILRPWRKPSVRLLGTCKNWVSNSLSVSETALFAETCDCFEIKLQAVKCIQIFYEISVLQSHSIYYIAVIELWCSQILV